VSIVTLIVQCERAGCVPSQHEKTNHNHTALVSQNVNKEQKLQKLNL
jgi:hypothetical protein